MAEEGQYRYYAHHSHHPHLPKFGGAAPENRQKRSRSISDSFSSLDVIVVDDGSPVCFVISSKSGAIFLVHKSSISEKLNFTFRWPCWLLIINKLIEDERISSDIRSYIGHVLNQYFKKRIFKEAIRFIMRKNIDDAYKAAKVLRDHYNLKMQAIFLIGLANTLRKAPFIHRLALLSQKMRRKLHDKRTAKLRNDLGKYKQFLDL